MTRQKFSLIHNYLPKTLEIVKKLNNSYKFVEPREAEILVVIGGDGELLRALHNYMHLEVPFYGINSGSVGFLMNIPDTVNYVTNIEESIEAHIYPLEMQAKGRDGNIYTALAVNEVSVFRHTSQAAKLKIEVDNIERMPELIADGILISTPAGSSAYNLSAGGPILPLSSNVLCLTSICSFRPRRWQGALLPSTSEVKFTILENHRRPVNAVADFYQFDDIISVSVKVKNDQVIKLLFDKNHSLRDKVIEEQFN
ncbi:MAG: NAD kinase [Janthinobacterium lividum]